MGMVKFVEVNKIYNNDIKVVNSLNLEIEKGELVSMGRRWITPRQL
jgi:ABC-type multidrug transport system ATPase subunit